MSYQLVAAKARSKGLDAVWSDVDIASMQIGALFANYANVWLTLSHSALTSNVYLNFATVYPQIAARYHNKTIPQWLALIGNASLPTNVTMPQFKLHHVRFNDAWQAGYTVTPIDRFRHEDAEIPYGEKNDLLLEKPGVDFNVHQKYALVSVNGYFHRTAAGRGGLMVVEGGRTGRLTNDNQVGVHSFKGVGSIDIVPITPTMVYKNTESGKLADRAYIQLPYSVENKTVLLVIGGYLHVLDETYTRIGPKTLRVNFNKIAFAERYFDTFKKMDLSSLPLTRNEDNEGHISVPELFSDDTIRAYLSLPQSFIVVVNTADFYVRRRPVANCELPGRYETVDSTGRLPLFGAFGKHYDYLIQKDWGVDILACRENTRPRYQFRTTDWRNRATIDNSLNPYRPWDWAPAHFLEMGRFS